MSTTSSPITTVTAASIDDGGAQPRSAVDDSAAAAPTGAVGATDDGDSKHIETTVVTTASAAGEAVPQRFQVYLIYSRSTLDDLREMLERWTDSHPEYIGVMRLDHSKDGKETNRALVGMHPMVYERLVQEGYHQKSRQYDFRITEYNFRDSNKPPKDCARALFIPLDKILDVLPFKSCQVQIEAKITQMRQMGFGSDNDVKANYPTVTREAKVAKYEPYVIITFSGRMHHDDTYAVKIMMDQLPWWYTDKDGGEHTMTCRASWCRRKVYHRWLKASQGHASAATATAAK